MFLRITRLLDAYGLCTPYKDMRMSRDEFCCLKKLRVECALHFMLFLLFIIQSDIYIYLCDNILTLGVSSGPRKLFSLEEAGRRLLMYSHLFKCEYKHLPGNPTG